MVETSFAIFFLFCLLTLMGLGPALFLFKNSLNAALATAPVIGLIFITVIGSYLVFYDYPVSLWATPGTIISISISLLLVVYLISKNNSSFNNNLYDKNLGIWLLGLFFTILVILLPMIVGGLNFTVLRGNAGDNYNYLMMAGYVQREPYSWFLTASTQALIDKHPSFISAPILLFTRYTVSVVLSWSSILSHVPLHTIDYGFTALFYILTYSCAYILSLSCSLKPRYAALVAIAVSVGFWSQLVIDMRAMSSIASTPLILFLAILVIHMQQNKNSIYHQILLAFGLAAMSFLYIEICPLVALGFLLFFTQQILSRQTSILTIINKFKYSIIIFSIIFFIYSYHSLLSFFLHQIHFIYSPHPHSLASPRLFFWFYQMPLLAFWGLSLLAKKHLSIIFLNILTGILSIVTIYSLKSFFTRNNNPAIVMVTSFFLALLAEFILVFSYGERWVAGKAISHGYPFIYLSATIAGLIIMPRICTNKFLLFLVKYSLLCWLLIQCSLGFYRVYVVTKKDNYSNYIAAYRQEYKEVDWDMDSFISAIKEKNISSLGVFLSDLWINEYISMALGWETKLLNFNGLHMLPRKSQSILRQEINKIPNYTIVYKDYPGLEKLDVIVHNKDFFLIKTPKSLLDQYELFHLSGLASAFYGDSDIGNWLRINKEVSFPHDLFSKNANMIMELEGKLFPRFATLVNLTIQVNGKNIISTQVKPGPFVWSIPVKKLIDPSSKDIKVRFIADHSFDSIYAFPDTRENRKLTVFIKDFLFKKNINHDIKNHRTMSIIDEK